MSSDNVKTVFLNALEIASPEARSAYLDAQCGYNHSLRGEVEELLRHNEQLAPLDESASVAKTTPPAAERPGTQIGPYKLLQQIGEGGMGVVYMAEQTEPIARRVALKIIKPGMDSRQVIARFEAERQALALMDYVNIARVLDAGTTPAGLPYFVMELVNGVPITKYCDDNCLTTRKRLELFVPVCQAIQHAHQKGIIHRDIKPSNVMVTLYDGHPVPKVIDFGVAKAIEQTLTERTLFTQYGTLVGTLEYMSPEQAEMSALGVDTRSDIFSLGVLLYELLTGGTPLSHKRLKEAAYGEILRMIREEEAPKPSTRLSDSGEALASISAQRHTEPAKLAKLMRGELDWIVMKTLEKDRNRRYETASGFAADVQRYLDDEPVQACPPSTGYRFWKFARRNRLVLNAALLVVSALALGTVVSTWQAIRASQAYQAETGERARAEANLGKAREAVHDYFTLVSESPQLDSAALQPFRKALLERALEFYREFLQQASDDLALQTELVATYFRVSSICLALGRSDDAVDALEQGARAMHGLTSHGTNQPAEFQRLSGLWKHLDQTHRFAGMPSDPARARAALEQVIAFWEELAREHPTDAGLQNDRAMLDHFMGDLLVSGNQLQEGMIYLQRADTSWRRLVEQHPECAEYRVNLARNLHRMAGPLRAIARPVEADRALDVARELRQSLVAEAPESTRYRSEMLHSLALSGQSLARRGETLEAEKDFRRAIELGDSLVTEIPGVPKVLELLAVAHDGVGGLRSAESNHEGAIESFRQAAELYRAMVGSSTNPRSDRLRWGSDVIHCAAALQKLAGHEQLHGDRNNAEAAYREALGLFGTIHSEFPERAFETSLALGELHARLSQWDESTAAYSKAIELKTERWEGWSGRAFTSFHQQQWDKSIADFSKAIDLAPKVHTNWWHRGHAYLQLAQWDKAAADFGNVVDQWPDGAEGWYLRSLAYVQLHQPEKAIADLRQAIAKGFKNVEQLKNDPKLAPVRTREDFGKLLEELQQKEKSQMK